MLFLAHGPIARSVADAVEFLEATAGHDPRDPMARRDSLPDLRAELHRVAEERPLANVRIAWSEDFGRFAVDADVRDCAQRMAEATETLGANVTDAAPAVEHPTELYLPIFGVDTRRAVYPLVDSNELLPETVAEFASYPELTAEEYVGLLARLARFQSVLMDFFERFDVLLTPTTAAAAFPIGQPPEVISGRRVEPGWMTFMPFSCVWNLGTNPAASVPAGLTSDGRPVGLMVVAAPGREDLVVRISATLEYAHPWGMAAQRPTAAGNAPSV